MTVFESNHASHARPHAVTLARRLTDAAARWLDARRALAAERRRQRLNRQAFRALLGKEDWVYRDMGTTKADVEWAAGLPLEANASRELERLRDRAQMGR